MRVKLKSCLGVESHASRCKLKLLFLFAFWPSSFAPPATTNQSTLRKTPPASPSLHHLQVRTPKMSVPSLKAQKPFPTKTMKK